MYYKTTMLQPVDTVEAAKSHRKSSEADDLLLWFSLVMKASQSKLHGLVEIFPQEDSSQLPLCFINVWTTYLCTLRLQVLLNNQL